MKAVLILVAWTLLFITADSAFAQSSREIADFVGEWRNVSEGGLTTRIVIADEYRKYSIHGWGNCHPYSDSDLGVVPLELLEPVFGRELNYGFATWDHTFRIQHMTLHLEGQELVAETINLYRDDSGRTNYRAVDRFKRYVKPSPKSGPTKVQGN
jgi:hypothetical protein